MKNKTKNNCDFLLNSNQINILRELNDTILDKSWDWSKEDEINLNLRLATINEQSAIISDIIMRNNYKEGHPYDICDKIPTKPVIKKGGLGFN